MSEKFKSLTLDGLNKGYLDATGLLADSEFELVLRHDSGDELAIRFDYADAFVTVLLERLLKDKRFFETIIEAMRRYHSGEME